MKPMGPIPAGFAAVDGELVVGGIKASALVEQAGQTPLFVYSAALIRQRVARLRAALPNRVGLHFAVKANPFAPVLQLMDGLVDGFDIASAGELAMLRAAGFWWPRTHGMHNWEEGKRAGAVRAARGSPACARAAAVRPSVRRRVWCDYDIERLL